MKYIFMYEHRFDFKVKKMAEILEVRRSGYYAWLNAGNKTKSDIQDEYFTEEPVELVIAHDNVRGSSAYAGGGLHVQ